MCGRWSFVIVLGLLAITLVGCTGSEHSAQTTVSPENQELALQHFLEGSLLDQKGEYAKAILEYQDALQYKKDPAIYSALAKDYAMLNKYELAVQNGKEAVKLDPGNQKYRELLAELYFRGRDSKNAVMEYRELVRRDSTNKGYLMNLAQVLQIENPREAATLFEAVIERFGPDMDAYMRLVQLYSLLEQPANATQALEGMLELEPSNFEIKKALGDSYLQRDSVDAALKIYRELVTLNPENIELRASIAHAFLLRQDYENAAEQFEAVMKKDSLSADEQLQFGRVFVSFIQRDSAVVPYALKLFGRIKESNPKDWRPYWFLGAISNIQKDDSAALENFSRVKDLAAWVPDGWIGMASIYYDNGKFEDAIRVLTEAKQYVPEEFRIHFLLGVACQRLNRNLEASSALEKAIQLDEKNVDALTALALTYDGMKRPADSDTLYERALRLDPNNHLLLNNYGYSLGDRGIQLDRALQMSKHALAQQPENQSYLDTYGWILFRLGRYSEAETYIRKAIELGSTSAVINEHLGDIYFKLSETEKALIYWQKAFQLDSSNQSLREKIERKQL